MGGGGDGGQVGGISVEVGGGMGGSGGVGVVERGSGWGVRVDVIEELKFLGKFTNKNFLGGGGGVGSWRCRVGGGGGGQG